MSRPIFLLLGWCLIQVLADRPDWFPEEINAIHRKCSEEYPVTMKMKKEIENSEVNDSPALRALLQCTVKGMNVYSSEKGFDADRLTYVANTFSHRPCNHERVPECLTKHSRVEPEGALVFNVLKCLFDREFSLADHEGRSNGTDDCSNKSAVKT